VSLAALVAWVPILPPDRAGPDEGNLGLVTDSRATHFWDSERLLPPLFARVLDLPAETPAWDVYLLYRPSVLWQGDEPPTPYCWQHQLSVLPSGHRLDPAAMVEALRQAG
jgi:hypothetical protein